MKDVIEFLKDNYQIIIVLAISIANLFVCLFRKKVKIVDSIREFILTRLPLLIGTAEKLFSDGLVKKEFVKKSIASELKAELNENFEDYEYFVDCAIEKILSTPEKKEVKE